jgi:hypothetical protein
MNNFAENQGGGLWNHGAAAMNVSHSTIAMNTTDGDGAGLYNLGAMTVANSTVSQNTAVGVGGGLANSGDSADAWLVNATVYDNGAGSGGGGIDNAGNSVEINNTIVAHDMATGMDCAGTAVATGGTPNLDSDGACGASITSDPMLGPLMDNGGLTDTHFPAMFSPVVDAGDDAVCTADPVNGIDQRGTARPVGMQCDIGAVEGMGNPTSVSLSDFDGGSSSLWLAIGAAVLTLVIGLGGAWYFVPSLRRGLRR